MARWVVVVTDRQIAPPTRGARIRILGLLRGLRALGWSVALISTKQSAHDQVLHEVDHLEIVKGRCQVKAFQLHMMQPKDDKLPDIPRFWQPSAEGEFNVGFANLTMPSTAWCATWPLRRADAWLRTPAPRAVSTGVRGGW